MCYYVLDQLKAPDNISQQSYYLDLNIAVLITDRADSMEEQILISFLV